jgi:hypothetical protein
VIVRNVGSKGPVAVERATLEPEGAFTILSQPSWPATLRPDDSITLVLALATAEPGEYAAKLRLEAPSCPALLADVSARVAPAGQPDEPGPDEPPPGGPGATAAPPVSARAACGLGGSGASLLAAAAALAWRRLRRSRRGGSRVQRS